jgi:threonine dehydrogenase-like Zn-dependent dehydrogenase
VTGTSRAAVLSGTGSLEIREFGLPAVGADDGLLRIEATGVCGSDIAAYHGHAPFYQLPCVLGHELVGRVERLGDEAARRWGVAEGDRVVVEEYLPCGTCRACLSGHYEMCSVSRYGARSIVTEPALMGGFADVMYLHPQAIVHRVHGDVPPELVQLYIPISNGIHWVHGAGGAQPGDTVVVIGPGPHGLGCVIGAREIGAGMIVLVGRAGDEDRLEVGRALGADHVLAGEPAEVRTAVADLTGGALAETVVNAANSSAALALAVALAGDRATVVQAGIADGDGGPELAAALVMRALTVQGVRGRPSRCVPAALRLIESGRYPLERMCTGTFELEQTEAALTALDDGPGAIRSVVVPGRT